MISLFVDFFKLKIMPAHFFTTPGNFFQYSSQKYGPLSESEYRTTSLFTVNSDTEAYAVTNGYFAIFDNIFDNRLVNLIIETVEAYPSDLTPKVKFYVYRGLRRSDFMYLNNGTYELHPLLYAQNNNLELLKYLYANYNQAPNSLTLSNLYYTGNDNVYNVLRLRKERCFIKEGIMLGKFMHLQQYSPGFEVVLDPHLQLIIML